MYTISVDHPKSDLHPGMPLLLHLCPELLGHSLKVTKWQAGWLKLNCWWEIPNFLAVFRVERSSAAMPCFKTP